jgi:hypothetical protein
LNHPSSDQPNRRAVYDFDPVAYFHLSPLPWLNFAVDANSTGSDQHLGSAAALDAARELEHLGQIDWATATAYGY